MGLKIVHLWTDQRIPDPVSCRCPEPRVGLLETPPRWQATICLQLQCIQNPEPLGQWCATIFFLFRIASGSKSNMKFLSIEASSHMLAFGSTCEKWQILWAQGNLLKGSYHFFCRQLLFASQLQSIVIKGLWRKVAIFRNICCLNHVWNLPPEYDMGINHLDEEIHSIFQDPCGFS